MKLQESSNSLPSPENTASEGRICPGHERALPIELTVNDLDMKEEGRFLTHFHHKFKYQIAFFIYIFLDMFFSVFVFVAIVSAVSIMIIMVMWPVLMLLGYLDLNAACW